MATAQPSTPTGPVAGMPTNPWQQILGRLEQKVSPQDFATWFQQTSYCATHDATLYVRVPNPTYKDWLQDHYRAQVEEAIQELRLAVRRIEYTLETPPALDAAPPPAAAPQVSNESSLFSPLNSKYSFASFVVGSSNQFAHAAALRVSHDPGRSYNPLFLYGGVGLGKTHLMHAIGHELRSRFPQWQVMYISAERFTNEMVQSIKNDSMVGFHQRFRNVDTLLVDDIQFLSGKEATQEEFFHTFNALYERHKPIVLSSDRLPREIAEVEERLRSRFGGGLVADIQPPDLETRQAILMKKAEAEQFALPEKVALFIATNIKSNIRDLEGSLVRLTAYASLTGEVVTEAMARQVLKDLMVDSGADHVSIELIQKTVCDFYGLRLHELKAKDNSKRVVVPRQVAMWLARRLTQASLPEIARAFVDKHHTTVLHSIAKITKQRLVDRDLNRALNKLLSSFE